MTEQQWLASSDPGAMLEVLSPHVSSTGHVSPLSRVGLKPPSSRKLRLFASACCLAWHRSVPDSWEFETPEGWQDAAQWAYVLAGENPSDRGSPVTKANLIRCIFGNHFRSVDPELMYRPPLWYASDEQRGRIWGLAQTAYDSRDFAVLPILADALEEAGCDNADILTHLRQPYLVRYTFAGATGCSKHFTREQAERAAEETRQHFHDVAEVCIEAPVHARGCWVLDLLLGKE